METTLNAPNITKSNEVTNTLASGRYGKVAVEFAEDLVRILKLDELCAAKIATQWKSDYGAGMKQAEVTAKVTGKYSKHGELTLKEAAKAKVLATYSISLMRLCSYLDEAFAFGLNPNKSTFVIASENLREYIAKCSAE